MNRSTLLFVATAAALLGCLLGVGALHAGGGAPTLHGGTPLAYRLLDPASITPQVSDSGRVRPATEGENHAAGAGALKRDQFEIVIPPRSWVEYKAHMEQGQSLVYTWSAEGGQVVYDFHADLPDSDSKFFTRYSRGQESEGAGSIVAAFSGLHGWYWRNRGEQPAVVRLEVSGFYDEIRSTQKEVASAQ